jgi:AraC-like DNA-binding protein
MEGTLNLKKFKAKAPCLFIVLADQILQCDYFSLDFSGLSIVMSKSFLEESFVDIQVSMPLFRSVLDNPWIHLNHEELKSMLEYFFLLQRAVRRKENPNLRETLKHLTLGFFYGTGYRFHLVRDESQKSKQDILVEKFLTIVKQNYRRQRMIEFYSEKLFLTPKHLSRVIKERSGKSSGEWIEDHVMLEAKALLKSTDKTIQQISDELNFPSQSFFGKYFKRRAGISPKEYRKSS